MLKLSPSRQILAQRICAFAAQLGRGNCSVHNYSVVDGLLVTPWLLWSSRAILILGTHNETAYGAVATLLAANSNHRHAGLNEEL